MEDPELAAIRAARMNQLQQQGPPNTNGGAGGEEAAAQRAADEEMRRNLLATVLDPAARERRMQTPAILRCPNLIMDRDSGSHCPCEPGACAADRSHPTTDGTDRTAERTRV